MSRIIPAAMTAAILAVAIPASAQSYQSSFPNLTYPPQPSTEAGQGCVEVSTVSGEACPTTDR